MPSRSQIWTVVDLFSGAGGMSYGFHAHPSFKIVGAADAEIGKPSTGIGALDCNSTYEANIGIAPKPVDLEKIAPAELLSLFANTNSERRVDVLLACPPCTGFSRTNSNNHIRDDPRNSLVGRVADFAKAFRPRMILMENARELVTGRFKNHITTLTARLNRLGYDVWSGTHVLTTFGLPQLRERAIVLAVEKKLTLRTLEDLWRGYEVSPRSITVRQAIEQFPAIEAGTTCVEDPAHTATLSEGLQLKRLKATPPDGGSWMDWTRQRSTTALLIPSMQRSIAAGTTNHFCDIYGRMSWDKPAPTIKRECSHLGNGRYAHPVQNRLCSVREMAVLQGFPRSYEFVGKSRKNMYRVIGDAVPPLVSFQLSCIAEWTLTGKRPDITACILPGTHLTIEDIVPIAPKRTNRVQLAPPCQLSLYD